MILDPDLHEDLYSQAERAIASDSWLPPDSPLEMPRQVLEDEARRPGAVFARILAAVLPGPARVAGGS
ncbi:hypothetical protein ACRARG_20820 [Pseudooceanicola sp. C21-150M6]|uniref:hypothetical protein n=1 Tax=Pseudooceanicola sp. C21-150M6 TaxID=3434355 RepID=UPI003D7F1AC9